MTSQKLIQEVIEASKQIDLNLCHYGIFHDNKTYLDQRSYYAFLAGLASLSRAKNVLEIGTYRGGSTNAISTGMTSSSCRLVTVDIKDFKPDFLKKEIVTHIIGDSLSEAVARQVLDNFPDGVDFIFIDAAHDGTRTMAETLFYDQLLRPDYIIWDDVNLNASMANAFRMLQAVMPGAVDVSIAYPSIRRPSEGFGFWHRTLSFESQE